MGNQKNALTQRTFLCILIIVSPRVISSAGRAPALQAGCRRFEPVIAHQVRSQRPEAKNPDKVEAEV